MAQDYNLIEVTNDSLINIAVDWYKKHGSDDERLKSYYYQGRIYENARNNEAAMNSFVRAESYKPKDKELKVVLYKSIARSYFNILDFEKANIYNEKAKQYYRTANDIDKYAGTMLFSSNLYYIQNQCKKAIVCLDSVRTLLDSISIPHKNAYYTHLMRLKVENGDNDSLSDLLKYYTSHFNNKDISWIDVAECYTFLKQYDLAKYALEQYKNYNATYKRNPLYHIASYTLKYYLKDYKAALENYINYAKISDSLSIIIAEQDTGFIHERYKNDLAIKEEKSKKQTTILISFFVIILLIGTLYIIRLQFLLVKQEKENLASDFSIYRKKYNNLKQEKDKLSTILANNPPINKESLSILNNRLELLNKFFTAAISLNESMDDSAYEELEQLIENRKEFLYNTRMTFSTSHPSFINFLESKGLTEKEIEYCCLYAIGLKGKDIGHYINRSCLYNESSNIRSKLGLGKHDTNLSNYLKALISQSYDNQISARSEVSTPI